MADGSDTPEMSPEEAAHLRNLVNMHRDMTGRPPLPELAGAGAPLTHTLVDALRAQQEVSFNASANPDNSQPTPPITQDQILAHLAGQGYDVKNNSPEAALRAWQVRHGLHGYGAGNDGKLDSATLAVMHAEMRAPSRLLQEIQFEALDSLSPDATRKLEAPLAATFNNAGNLGHKAVQMGGKALDAARDKAGHLSDGLQELGGKAAAAVGTGLQGLGSTFQKLGGTPENAAPSPAEPPKASPTPFKMPKMDPM